MRCAARSIAFVVVRMTRALQRMGGQAAEPAAKREQHERSKGKGDDEKQWFGSGSVRASLSLGGECGNHATVLGRSGAVFFGLGPAVDP